MGHQLLNASWLVMTCFKWVHELDKLHTNKVNRGRQSCNFQPEQFCSLLPNLALHDSEPWIRCLKVSAPLAESPPSSDHKSSTPTTHFQETPRFKNLTRATVCFLARNDIVFVCKINSRSRQEWGCSMSFISNESFLVNNLVDFRQYSVECSLHIR